MNSQNDIKETNNNINVDSLWLIPERDKSGRHKNIYHGNFIPQIPNQLIRRYTKEQDIVMEPFAGSGTTLFECEKLNRKYIGFDINDEIINYVKNSMGIDFNENKYCLEICDSLNEIAVNEAIQKAYNNLNAQKVQFVLMHPPYMDIVKFTNNEHDLSQISTLQEFLAKFKIICINTLKYLETNQYFAIVIGDVYKKSEVIPLGFYCLDMIKNNFNVKLKGIIVKNIEGNRGKLGQAGIWKYRALKSDYFLFKHEYILVFKKEF